MALRLLSLSDGLTQFIATHFGRKWLTSHEGNNLSDQARAPEFSAILREAYRFEGSMYALFDTLQHFGLFDRESLYRSVGDLALPTMLMWGRMIALPLSTISTKRPHSLNRSTAASSSAATWRRSNVQRLPPITSPLLSHKFPGDAHYGNDTELIDVLIVGAGPAGTALRH